MTDMKFTVLIKYTHPDSPHLMHFSAFTAYVLRMLKITYVAFAIFETLKMHFQPFGLKGLKTSNIRFTKLQDNKAQTRRTSLSQTVSV